MSYVEIDILQLENPNLVPIVKEMRCYHYFSWVFYHLP